MLPPECFYIQFCCLLQFFLLLLHRLALSSWCLWQTQHMPPPPSAFSSLWCTHCYRAEAKGISLRFYFIALVKCRECIALWLLLWSSKSSSSSSSSPSSWSSLSSLRIELSNAKREPQQHRLILWVEMKRTFKKRGRALTQLVLQHVVLLVTGFGVLSSMATVWRVGQNWRKI